MSKRIKAITFDLDDTLWQCDDIIAHANQKFFAYLRDRYPRIPEKFDPHSFRDLITQYCMEGGPDSHDFGQLRRRAIRHACEHVGYNPEDVVEDAYEVFARARQEVQLYDSVMPLMRKLKGRGFVLGTITNGTANVYEMDHLGSVIDFALRPSDVGVAKPHLDIFQQAHQLAHNIAQCDPHEILHVGDSYPCDVEGGKLAGFRTVWINNPKLTATPWRDCPHPEPHHADHVIEHIDHLERVLSEYHPRAHD